MSPASDLGLDKFHNAEVEHKMFVHDLIRGSLDIPALRVGAATAIDDFVERIDV